MSENNKLTPQKSVGDLVGPQVDIAWDQHDFTTYLDQLNFTGDVASRIWELFDLSFEELQNTVAENGGHAIVLRSIVMDSFFLVRALEKRISDLVAEDKNEQPVESATEKVLKSAQETLERKTLKKLQEDNAKLVADNVTLRKDNEALKVEYGKLAGGLAKFKQLVSKFLKADTLTKDSERVLNLVLLEELSLNDL